MATSETTPPSTSGRAAIRDALRPGRVRRRLGEAVRDNVWLLPLLGALTGLLLALAVGTGGGPERDPWTVTVDRARDTLTGSLALVFTALSIVLALASVAAQNVVGRFGSRVLRVYVRRSADRWVIGMFTLAATFILVEQFQLRRLDPDAPAPIAGLLVSVLLLVATSAMVIWYISSLIRWFRTDRAVAAVVRATRESARRLAHYRRHVVPTVLPDRPPEAIDLRARRSGHLADVDADAVLGATGGRDVTVLIERESGDPVVAGQPIGWIAAADGRPDPYLAERVTAGLDISRTRELEHSLTYAIVALVDIAIIALSPAVNDPNSAVEVIEELSFLFPELVELPLGPVAVTDTRGSGRVVVVTRTFGEFVDLATDQIVLYGADDPNVQRALRRLARSLELLELGDVDRTRVEALVARVDDR